MRILSAEFTKTLAVLYIIYIVYINKDQKTQQVCAAHDPRPGTFTFNIQNLKNKAKGK